MEQQPHLSFRRGDSTAHIRMDSVNRESMEGYFNLLEDTLKEHDLMNRPAQIYNMDESGMPLEARPPNMVAKRGQKKVRYRQSGKKGQISVIGCANAVGQSIPPMVIFEGKYLNLQWTVRETQDSQPLDCTVLGPLKHHWSATCHEFQQKHPGMVISKLNFIELFAKAWLQALTPANIVAGFRSRGIYPFNRSASVRWGSANTTAYLRVPVC